MLLTSIASDLRSVGDDVTSSLFWQEKRLVNTMFCTETAANRDHVGMLR